MNVPSNLPNQGGIKTVLNLSKSFQCTEAQFSILNKGLNFIPTRGTNANIVEQARFDLQQYHRRLKLAAYYEGSPTSEKLPFTTKSTWSPPQSVIPQEIIKLIDTDLNYFHDNFGAHLSPANLSPQEVQALLELSKNKNIVIKPADKGSAIVIMDKQQYLWEGYRQLNDPKYYVKLKKPIFWDTIPLVHKILQTLYDKKFINMKQKYYLMGDSETRARIFYMLPKIHKDPTKWSRPNEIPPGRPIVSDCSSETYHTAEYIDSFLNPLSMTHPSYIKDTYHFVNLIKDLIIPQNAILFTIDIDSLYTNIDSTEGIQAVKEAFQKNPNKHRPEKELIQLLEINLNRNDFTFNQEFFLQIKGTAMGKKFAPAYANIFMAQWETSALEACPLKPLHYYRYLDDIWGVWSHSMEEFEKFINILHTHRESIKIKSTKSLESVDFLDTTTFKGHKFLESGTLDVKVFFKETDTHALLFKNSFHPKHTFAGLIKSQLLRFHRICTRSEDFKIAVKILFQALSTRGYCRSFCRQGLKNFLKSKPIPVTSYIPLITTYSPSTLDLAKKCRKNFDRMSTASTLLQDCTIMPAFRRNKNLQEYLVRAKIQVTAKPKSKNTGKYFKQKEWFKNQNTGEMFQSRTGGNLTTNNCIYLISCMSCKSQYVGETGNSLSTRFAQHKYNFVHKKKLYTPLVAHMLQHGWEALQVTIIESNRRWKTTQRRAAERRWIALLGTRDPGGLNEH